MNTLTITGLAGISTATLFFALAYHTPVDKVGKFITYTLFGCTCLVLGFVHLVAVIVII